MKKLQLLLLMLLATPILKAQGNLTGYFIKNDGQKIECFILDELKNNPTSFTYKLASENENRKADITTVKEFGVYNVYKYIRDTVDIDRSEDDDLRYTSSQKLPEFKQEVLFLKVLVEGKASLYQYENRGLLRFFFKAGDSAIKQLVYKKYEIEGKINEDNSFREQIWLQLSCENISMDYVKSIPYDKAGLTDFFAVYNKCYNITPVVFKGVQKKADFNLTIRPHLNYTSFSAVNSSLSSTARESAFDTKLQPSIGIEAEVVLPYNKRKWAIIAEPAYQYYKDEFTVPSNTVVNGFITTSVDYKGIDIPLGFRYYFHLGMQSKIFINAVVINTITFNSSYKQTTSDGVEINNLKVRTPSNIAGGAGYKYANKFSAEVRYYLNRQLLSTYYFWNSKMSTISLVLGYTLF